MQGGVGCSASCASLGALPAGTAAGEWWRISSRRISRNSWSTSILRRQEERSKGKSTEPKPGLEWGVWEGQDMEGAQQQQDPALGGFCRAGSCAFAQDFGSFQKKHQVLLLGWNCPVPPKISLILGLSSRSRAVKGWLGGCCLWLAARMGSVPHIPHFPDSPCLAAPLPHLQLHNSELSLLGITSSEASTGANPPAWNRNGLLNSLFLP